MCISGAIVTAVGSWDLRFKPRFVEMSNFLFCPITRNFEKKIWMLALIEIGECSDDVVKADNCSVILIFYTCFPVLLKNWNEFRLDQWFQITNRFGLDVSPIGRAEIILSLLSLLLTIEFLFGVIRSIFYIRFESILEIFLNRNELSLNSVNSANSENLMNHCSI